MKCFNFLVFILFSWSFVLAIEPIRVEDPSETTSQESPNNSQSNTTFFLSVIPVQEPGREDSATPQVQLSSVLTNNSQWSDNNKSPIPAASTTSNAAPVTEVNIDEDSRSDTSAESAVKTSHEEFSGLVVSNQQQTPKLFSGNQPTVSVHHSGTRHHQMKVQRESEAQFRREKEFVPSPQLGQWSGDDANDYKRLLADSGNNNNNFYPVRPQPASIKSTSFIGSGAGVSGDYDKSSVISVLPPPKFHSGSYSVNHLSQDGPPVEIPHYALAADFGRVQFNAPGNHRTVHFDPGHFNGDQPAQRVTPLGNLASSELTTSRHRSTNFVQPDHPYTFDFGHGESAANQPPLDIYDLNKYEKMPHIEHHEKHLHHHLHQAPRHNPGPWKKIVHVLAAAIPLGFVISALTPHVVFVNPNDTSIENIKKFPTSLKPFPAPPLPNPSFVTYYPRWRALVENSQGADTHALLDKGNNAALMEFLTKISNSLTEIPGSDSCEDRAFCEMAVMGSNSRAAPEQQLLWKIATQTTDAQVRKSGMGPIFRAIRDGRCGKIKCKKS